MKRGLKPEQEFDRIRNGMLQFPGGATALEILEASGLSITLRTLQRRLGALIEANELYPTGKGRAARYHLATKNDVAPAIADTGNERSIILSPESEKILTALSIPIQERKAVSYNLAFVDSYRPNIDHYLSEQERANLAQLAATPTGQEQPAGTYARHILQRLLIDLSWNSSRLEGNTYSLLDTERLLSKGQPAAGKPEDDAQMILNHKEAIEFIVAGAGEIDFNEYTIRNLHAILANNLLPDPAAPGRLRTHAVGVNSSVYSPPDIPQLIEEMFTVVLKKAVAIENPHEAAFFVMVHLPYLQPFDDVNKRVSRLAANIPLNRRNMVPISFTDVSLELYTKGMLGIYELNNVALLKDVFLWACIRSANRYAMVRQTISSPDPFRIKYRQLMQQIVPEIILQNMSFEKAAELIQLQAENITESDRQRFIELIETELLSLHEGNFARYRVSPAEFSAWKKNWIL
jgi:hypothetical protein